MGKFYTIEEFEALVRERVKPRPAPKRRKRSREERARNDHLRDCALRQWEVQTGWADARKAGAA